MCVTKEANAGIRELLKKEQPCFCQDKGVIELVEQAVAQERARIREAVVGLETYSQMTAVDDFTIKKIETIALADVLALLRDETPTN